jgi:2-dehydro-3-deoxygluconokinase
MSESDVPRAVAIRAALSAVEVVTLGESMVMVTPICPVPLEQSDNLIARVGGAESNVAMYLAGLGHRTAWASRLGNDPFGRMVRRLVSDAGVDCSAVATDCSAPTGVYFKDPDPTGTRVYYYRAGSAASRLDATALDHPRLSGARVLHLSGITPALSPTCQELVERALYERPVTGAKVSFDVNFRPALWTGDAGPTLQKLANAADLVFVGLDEAEMLWGVSGLPAIRRLLPDPAVVVVKHGSVGASALTHDGTTVFEPAVRVDLVEPVGAGDAFAAGYLSASLRELELSARLRMGHLVAAHALTVTADHTSLPGRDWFDVRLAWTAQEWSAMDSITPFRAER